MSRLARQEDVIGRTRTGSLRGLTVYGDIGMDFYIRTPYRPDSGQDAKVDRFIIETGGSAANCAAVAAKLGIPTTFIGFIGSDYFGEIVKQDLKIYGVSIENLIRIPGDTGITTAVIEPGGERTFYSYRGVNATGTLPSIYDAFFRENLILHISGYSFQDTNSRKNALGLIRKARESDIQVSLDPSFWFAKEFLKQYPAILSDVNIIFPSQEEARYLGGSGDPVVAARKIREMGPETVIVTLGPEGCYISSGNQSFHLPAEPIPEVIDTTGAGDAFCGGFLAARILELNLIEAAMLGNLASSCVIGQFGGHKGAPSLETLASILKERQEDELAGRIINSIS